MDESIPEEQQLREINHRLMRLDAMRRIVLQRTAKANGLFFGQLPILEYIAGHQGCTQNQIAEEIGVTPASIALSTKRLQRSGLIDKKADERNLRRNVLTVTSKGVAHMESCRRQFDAVDRRMYAGFEQEELHVIMDLLDRMLANLSEGLDGLDDIYSMMVLIHRLEREADAVEQDCGPPDDGQDVFADRRARLERRAAALRDQWERKEFESEPSGQSAGPSAALEEEACASGKPERFGASRGLPGGEAASTAALEEEACASGKPERSGSSRGLPGGEAASTAALEEKEGHHG